ncbi:MAG: sulfate transporter [Planctomycetaceae bacterium]|nr:MAG: sulfate transporter [Planctomycetaceae bacterium]
MSSSSAAHLSRPLSTTIPRDLMAGLIVFLVALPLCLGIALASGAPLFSGLIAGIVGGIVVGMFSGSHTSVSGPAAGLTAIVAAQIASLGSFEAFLLAVLIGGVLQIALGVIKAGALSAFFPSSVIKGLLAAIGALLLIKQLPYLLGHDMVPKVTSDGHSGILSQIAKIFTGEIHLGALVIGLISLAVLIVWEQIPRLKKSLVPAPLLVVIIGFFLAYFLNSLGGVWALSDTQRLMVNVPIASGLREFLGFLTLPDFSQWANPAIYIAGVTVAIVASLETLLNLDAVDRLDKQQRISPPSRELIAQGVGNIACGLLGGIPVTSVIIRGSVNVNAGAQTKLSTIFHGLLLLICVGLVPGFLNRIPLSCLAAILLMTGYKLASPKLFKQMWSEGRYQFAPFVITLVAIVATDLLIGIVIGLIVSLLFILKSNLTLPVRQIVENHVGGKVLHIELANQVSFLNRAALEKALRSAESGSHILLDARRTDYIDPDILSLIREFKEVTAPVYGVRLSLRGFREKYELSDEIQFADFATRELHSQLTPGRVLQILKDGNERFHSGHPLDRDLTRPRLSGATREHPMAVIFSGINPRTPAEMVFDLGLGDVYSVRTAGTVVSPAVLASMEYACVVGGAKLILVMGHAGSGIVRCSVDQSRSKAGNDLVAGCKHLQGLISEIQHSIDEPAISGRAPQETGEIVRATARRNVLRAVQEIVRQSEPLGRLVDERRLAVVGAILDNASGQVEFLTDAGVQGTLDTPSDLAPGPVPRSAMLR